MARRHRTPAGVLPGALAGVLAAGLLAGCTSEPPVPEPVARPVSSAPPGPTTAAPSPALSDVPVRDATAPAPEVRAAPVRLAVPDVDLDMPVVPVGVLDDGTMEIPEDAGEAGWYRFGPVPADDDGNTLVAAHVDSRLTGIGPFARLRDVPPGATVTVTDADGTAHRYRVTGVEKIPKDSAPLDVWFARSGPPRLVLVTCGGTWQADIGHYSDNVVVTAEPVADRP
ncbi:class F sortase [Cellulomonas sp. PSBB021]|uniref:class F sortase n=1 Tax=Cellulomonas sp. PSBB021 TaxID=2003551 RepID=UPI000B8DA45D|nr:class F sortase [Cellulomonas sp. PSBB021]ASR55806.1 sortase [Cellulomonas sp. PSBB021]